MPTQHLPQTGPGLACSQHRHAPLMPAMRSGLGFPRNRRDGARQLSIVILVAAMGLARIDHPVGQAVLITASLLALYWWRLYRQLTS